MGNVCSTNSDAATEKSRLLDKKLADDFATSSKVFKLLLLGAGESGKSTVAKQMRILYLDGFRDDEREMYKDIVFSNTIQSMRVLAKATSKLGIEADDSSVEEFIEVLQTTPSYPENFTSELVEMMKALWASKAIRSAYDQRNTFQLNDSADYYFDRLDMISANDYTPTDQDILRSRVKTTGIVEIEFEFEKTKFCMMDVGGQRNERKKWIHCFEGVTALIFCVSLVGYDQVLREDESVNRMDEALILFDEVVNSRWFKDSSIILFLNKLDLFKEKLKTAPLRLHFEDYAQGPSAPADDAVDPAVDYIQQQFMSKAKSPEMKIYPHRTCATDTSNIKFVFVAVRDMVLENNLHRSGFQ